MRQTTIQDVNAIRKGSTRVLVGNDFDNLVDIGALRNPQVNFLNEAQRIEFDNANGLDYFIKGDRIQATFDLAEINLDTIAVLDAGMVNIEHVAGTIVNNANQLIVAGGWSYNTFVQIANQNGNGAIINIDSVTASVNGALVANTDYVLTQGPNGKWGIIILDSATVTTLNQNVTIQYDYTPNASKKITTQETGKKTLKCMRIINENNDGKIFKLDISDGTNMAPISIDYAGDQDDDVAIQAVDFQGVFVEWIDEQQTA